MIEGIVRVIDRAAGGAALRLVAWAARRVDDPAHQQWVDAVRGEIEAIEGGRARLAWAIGGVRLAITLGVRPKSAFHTPGGAELRSKRLPGGATSVAEDFSAAPLGAPWRVVRSRRTLSGFAAVAIVGVLVMAGTSAAVSASQPDQHCTALHTASSNPPSSPVSAADYLALGDVDYDRGACDQAIADYSRAIELDPQFAAAFNNRAYTLMRKQNYAAALADLDRAVELRPDYSNALINRGDIHNYYYQIDRYLAVADYDRVLAIGQQEHTGVCGHRLLAYYDGWSPGVAINLISSGVEGGCQVGSSAP